MPTRVLYRVERTDGSLVYVYAESGQHAALLVENTFAVSVVYHDMVLVEE